MSRLVRMLSVAVLAGLIVSGCAAPTPVVVEREKVVEKPVVQTVVVEKQVPVEKKVVETVVVEKVQTVVVEVEKPTPTPEPKKGPTVKDKELTIAVQTHPDGIDPHQCAYNNCFIISRKIGDTLVAKAPDGTFKPYRRRPAVHLYPAPGRHLSRRHAVQRRGCEAELRAGGFA